jgi:hypothetical protein
MTPLSKKYVDNCPIEGSFRLRGTEMTRIEVFVDAAFAFAVTMLVISFDAIPTNFAEFVLAIKGTPAFIMAVIQLVWIWYAHNIWSKRFGLEDPIAVMLSTALLVVVLIYIYPMRIMIQGMFTWFTNGYLPVDFDLGIMENLASMFVFLGIGFIALSLTFVLMYRYAGSLKAELLLNEIECYQTKTFQIIWLGVALIGGISIVLAMTLPLEIIPYCGFAYSLMMIWFPLIRRHRSKQWRLRKQS